MVGPNSQPSPQPPRGCYHPGLSGRRGGWEGCCALCVSGNTTQGVWDVQDIAWLLGLHMGSQEGFRVG